MGKKIALCYFGNCGWEFDKDCKKITLHPDKCFESVKKNIINVNKNIDIFIHSWSIEQKQQILDTIKPTDFIIENQKYFYKQVNQRKRRIATIADLKLLTSDKLNNYLNPNSKNIRNKYINRAYSRWYSTKKVIELKNNYEKSNDLKYDYVMLLRMDVEFYSKINFEKYNPLYFHSGDSSNLSAKIHSYLTTTHIGLIKDLPKISLLKSLLFKLYDIQNDKKYTKKIFWTQPNMKAAISMILGLNYYHLSDTWFFSGNAIMKNFGLLYDDVGKYHRSPHISSYQHLLKIIDKKNVCFPLRQYDDYELYRQGKNSENKDLIIGWLNEVL